MNRDTRRTRLVLALLLLVSFTLVTVDYRGGDSSPLHGLRTFAADVFSPVESAATAVVRPVSSALGTLGGLGHDQKEIDRLRAENGRLRRELDANAVDRSRVDQLHAMLGMAGIADYTILPAIVTAMGSRQGFGWTITIDGGTRDGLHKNMTVLDPQGLVGRIISVSRLSATVLLAVDPTAGVGVSIEGQGVAGLVRGTGNGPLALEIGADVRMPAVGDRLVTFGSKGGTPFVPGVPVGEIIAVDATPGSTVKTARVRPYVDFESLDLVSVVVQPPRTNPRGALLGPKPTPSAAGIPSAAGGG